MSLKKIVIISNDRLPIPALLGGAVENLMTSLLSKNEAYDNFRFIVFSPYINEIEQSNINFAYTKFIFINTNSFIYKLIKAFRYLLNKIPGITIENQYLHEVKKSLKKIKDVDIILIQNSPIYLNFLNNFHNTKLILHLHNDYISNNIDYNDRLFSKANLILTVSEYLKNKIIANTTINLNVEVLYNGIDINRFNADIDSNEIIQLRSLYNIQKNNFLIAYAGRLQEDKGVDKVIDAFIKFNQRYKSKLIIIGGSEFANNKSDVFLQKIIDKTRIHSHNIIFTNYVDYSKIHLYYQLPDVFVLPSLCEEAFGMTVLEALASSKPVIVTDAGGIPEVVSQDCSIILRRDNRLIDNIVNSLVTLYKDQAFKVRLSENARIRSLKFTDNLFFDRFSILINKI